MRARLVIAISAVAAVTGLVAGCDYTRAPSAPVGVTVRITPDPAPSVPVGQVFHLVASVSGATFDQRVTWTSSNTNVATVTLTPSGSGLVACVSAGVAVMTATSVVDTSATGSASVTCLAAVF